MEKKVNEIKFKATRRRHSSGYRVIEKSGQGLRFDCDRSSDDGIWINSKNGGRAFLIDCDSETGEFRLLIEDTTLFRENKDITN